MHTALLPGADADCLAVFRIADGVRLRILERNQCNQKIALRIIRNFLVRCYDVFKQRPVDYKLVAPLLKRHAEHILMLHGRGDIIRIDPYNIIAAAALAFEDFERLVRIAGRDDTVGNLTCEQTRRLCVTNVGEGRPVAIGRHAVRAARARVSACDRRKLQIVDKVNLFFNL